MNTTDMKKKIIHQTLLDIFVMSVVDLENGYVDDITILMSEGVYIKCKDQVIHLKIIDNSVGRFLKLINTSKPALSVDVEDENQAVKISILSLLLPFPENDLHIESIELYGKNGIAQELFEAIAINLNNSQTLFFDPLYWKGIHIGHPLDRDEWLAKTGCVNCVLIE